MRHSTLGAATLAVLATWGTVTAGIALRQQGLFRSVSRGGTIVIGQPQDHQVLFYSATGKRLAAFGRNGDGPGEFRDMGWFGWISDTRWVHSSNRFTYISPQYKLLRDVPAPPYAAPTAEEIAAEAKDLTSPPENLGSSELE